MKVNRKEIWIEGLQNTCRYLHITDTHAGRESLTKDGIPAAARLAEYVEYANAERVTGVLLTGDIIDDPSAENLTFLEQNLHTLTVPWMYIPGNHDWAFADNYHTDTAILEDWPRLLPFCKGEEAIQIKKIGEITWIGIDNSIDMYWQGTAEKLKKALEDPQNRSVIILQHIPFECGTLAQASLHRWGKVLTLGKNLPERGTCREVEADSIEKIRELILGTKTVKALICGHLHLEHMDMLSDRIPQYVSTESCFGETTLFEIHG